MTQKQYNQKIKTLQAWAKAYYVEDNPIATDEEYDKLYHDILAYEQSNPAHRDPNSPTQRVGGDILKGFKKAKHLSRMWSQEDIFNTQELEEWIKRVSKVVDQKHLTFICEPKFDGASLNIIYENGTLKQAITRGDGSVGEDVTQNVKTIHSIPLSIPYDGLIEIRGEIVIKKEDHRIDIFPKQIMELFLLPENKVALNEINEISSSSMKVNFFAKKEKDNIIFSSDYINNKFPNNAKIKGVFDVKAGKIKEISADIDTKLNIEGAKINSKSNITINLLN